MQDKLHRFYQVWKEVSGRSCHHGVIALEELGRLATMLYTDRSEVLVEFKITLGDFDSPVIKGHVETELAIECQRCLEAVELAVELDFELLIDATDDEVKHCGLDTVYSKEGVIDIFDVVEDELILGLPLAALHEDKRCNVSWHVSENVPEAVEKENPFLVLQKLKTTH